jgi:hypothetical protein
MYRAMTDTKQRLINKEDEMDDELEMAMVLLIGQKRIRMNHRGRIGSVIGHEVHNRQR